jgi:hypothetical protein
MLRLGDLRARHRRVDVGVRDRLALDPHLLALHRHGLLHLLGHDVLAQARAATLAALGADAQFLLGARHRVIRTGRAARGASLTALGPVQLLLGTGHRIVAAGRAACAARLTLGSRAAAGRVGDAVVLE